MNLGYAKNSLLVVGSALAIIGSAAWIYYREFARPPIDVHLNQAVGLVMAEETHQLVGHLGKVLIVTTKLRRAPELKVQIQAFEKQLKTFGGITVKDQITLDPGDNPKYRPGSGLSAKRLLKIFRKNRNVDAIVSFVGAPTLTEAEIGQLKTHPKFIAETHSPEKLVNLFVNDVLHSAIVPRYEFPAPGPRKPETARQWFDRYYQIVTPATLSSLTNALSGNAP